MHGNGGDEQSGVTDEQAAAALGSGNQAAAASQPSGPLWLERRGADFACARTRQCERGLLWRPFVITTGQTAIRTGLGHLDSVLDHWYQSPRAGCGPQPGHVTSTAAQSVTAGAHAAPRFAGGDPLNKPTVQLRNHGLGPFDRQSPLISIAAAKRRCAIRAPMCDGIGRHSLVSVHSQKPCRHSQWACTGARRTGH